ncbi:MAG: T9SS type A sorting domain-containing protein [Sphingobacteriales bacterium]|nr:MAG: T9SS type A sorting domain-containing protein [Sphingobacteriales bacterium]
MFKKLLPLFALCFTTYVQAQTLYPGGIPNCIARYSFDSTSTGTITTVTDVSGNGNNSNVVNNVVATAGFRSRANTAALFNGSSSQVFIPDAPMLNPGTELSMIALVRPDGFYAGICQISEILSKGFQGKSPGNYYMGFSDNRYDGEDGFAYDTSKMQLEPSFGPVYITSPAGPYVHIGQWFLVAATYSGDEMAFYTIPMDRERKLTSITPDYTGTVTGNMGSNTDALTLGYQDVTTFPYWFNGAMDEVAIFNRGLSNTEIYSIYNYLWSGSGGSTTAVANNQLMAGISTYPNPATDMLNIRAQLNASTAQLEVYNAMGQKLLAENVTATSGNLQHSMNTSNLPTGIYTLKLTAGGAVKTMRFTVQR